MLLFLNIISTGYLWIQRMEKPDDRQPKKERENSLRVLKDKLHLTREQESALISLRNDFAQKEESITQMIRSQRDSMNVLMFRADNDTSQLKRMARKVADNEYQLEQLRIDQAQKLKSICTAEQLMEFQNLVINIRDFFQPQNSIQNPSQKQPRKKKE